MSKLRIGDTVRIKKGPEYVEDVEFVQSMRRYIGWTARVTGVESGSYILLDVDGGQNYWTRPWLEKLVEERRDRMDFLLQQKTI